MGRWLGQLPTSLWATAGVITQRANKTETIFFIRVGITAPLSSADYHTGTYPLILGNQQSNTIA